MPHIKPLETPHVRPFSRSERISRRIIQAGLDEAGISFRSCLSMISAIRTGKASDATLNPVLDFQPLLLDALEALESLYRLIKREEKRLVTKKAKYKPQWFRARMASLKSYADFVMHGLIKGREVGDAFAWLFYERDRSLIQEHYADQQQLLLPPNLGAVGERLALRRLQGLGGKFLLYHGITTFLRMGDVSFLDPDSMRIVSIGELKTERLDASKIAIHVSIIAGDPTHLPGAYVFGRQNNSPPAMDRDLAIRLRRQIDRIAKAFTQAQADTEPRLVERDGTFHMAELETLVERAHSKKFQFIKLGSGLILGAWRHSRRGRFGYTIMRSFPAKKLPLDDLPNLAVSTFHNEAEFNSLIVDTMGCDHSNRQIGPEQIPFLLWPLKQEVREQIHFGEVMVVSVFNPGHLWAALRDRGFEIGFNAKGPHTATIKIDNRKIKLENFPWFSRLVYASLMSEESVLTLIDRFLEQIKDSAASKSARITLLTKIVHSG